MIVDTHDWIYDHAGCWASSLFIGTLMFALPLTIIFSVVVWPMGWDYVFAAFLFFTLEGWFIFYAMSP